MPTKDCGCWVMPAGALQAPTVEQARDLMVECFFHAHHETLARVKRTLSASPQPPSDDALRRNIRMMLKVTMRENADDFDRPTVASLGRLLTALRAKAAAWGTPDDIIQHHCAQIGALLGQVSPVSPEGSRRS